MERKGCESSIHDHTIDFCVTMVGWLDVPNSDWGVTSDVGVPSTYLIPVQIDTHQYDNFMPVQINSHQYDKFIPLQINTHQYDNFIPLQINSHQYDNFIPVQIRTHQYHNYIPVQITPISIITFFMPKEISINILALFLPKMIPTNIRTPFLPKWAPVSMITVLLPKLIQLCVFQSVTVVWCNKGPPSQAESYLKKTHHLFLLPLTSPSPSMALNITDPHELLTCSICAESYDNNARQAKFLSCFHTFCLNCLTKLSNKGQVNRGTIQCPNCRSSTHLGGKGVAGLQNNFYITSLQEFSENSGPRRTSAKLDGCNGHNKQPISHFCVTCGISICRDCTIGYHKAKSGHTVISITKADIAYFEELNVSHNSVTQNNESLQLIESEIALLTAVKKTAIQDVEVFIKDAHEQLEQRRNNLLKDISDRFNAQQNFLREKQKQIDDLNKTLIENIIQAKDSVKAGNLRQLKPIGERLKKINEKMPSIPSGLDLGENYLAFDSKKGVDAFNKSLSELGQVYSKGFLPSMVVFGSTEAMVDNEVTVPVDVSNHHGEKFLLSPHYFSVLMTGPTGLEVQTVLCTTDSECAVTFTPESCGLHKISGIFMGQTLINGETHLAVGNIDPVLKFGKYGQGSGTFDSPWGIAIDNENCLYVAEFGNGLIQKFTPDGEFISQFRVNLHNKNFTTVDMALDLNRGLLLCMEVLNENNRIAKGKTILVFDLAGELQHTYTPSAISNARFIAINKQGELILSDVGKKCLHKVEREGNFLSHMGDFQIPGFIAITEDDGIIVPDKGADCIYILNSDGTIRHKFGSSGTGMGQLKEPWGVATDGEYILVSEGGNNRIQVFNSDGTFVSVIKSSEDPLSQPRGLAVTKDGHVYVADRDNHCIKKYKYRDMH